VPAQSPSPISPAITGTFAMTGSTSLVQQVSVSQVLPL
jgi:hypothetical protein